MSQFEAWPNDDWFQRLAQGESEAVAEFWETFGEPLRRVAQRQISSSLAQRVDPEDIVQSACRTFFRRAGQGEFDCRHHDDLWRLMLTITLNKARMQARHHARARRNINAQRPLDAEPMVNRYENAIEEIDFSDFLNNIFERLDEENSDILQRLLEGQTQEQIAVERGCSERTVRRMKSRIRESLEFLLGESLGSQS